MFLNISGIPVNYEVNGEGNNVIMLHGWGASIESLKPVLNYLSKYFKTYAIDLPGFGKSEEPANAWSVSDYSAVLEEFIKQFKIDNPILMGHSNGGRVIIHFSAKSEISIRKIILIDSAGIKPRRPLKYYIKVYSFKLLKKLLTLPLLKKHSAALLEKARSMYGSSDYSKASPVMRQTLVRLVNEDLRHCLPEIKCPVLLIWGENDTATPVSDGKLMEKLIRDAGLVVFKNAGHFSYLDKLNDFLKVVTSFLKEDMIS